jgi:endonuclease YncB( thermonuclease family)
MNWIVATVLPTALALVAAQACAQSMGGTVTLVIDGDTLWIRPDSGDANARKPRAFRLRGIDAPESCQAWGPQAKAALEARVLHRQVRLRSHATDSFQRQVATLTLDGEDMGAWMVAQGHAWNSGYGQQRGAYAAQEISARSARRGLFAQGDALEPRKFRGMHGPCRPRS